MRKLQLSSAASEGKYYQILLGWRAFPSSDCGNHASLRRHVGQRCGHSGCMMLALNYPLGQTFRPTGFRSFPGHLQPLRHRGCLSHPVQRKFNRHDAGGFHSFSSHPQSPPFRRDNLVCGLQASDESATDSGHYGHQVSASRRLHMHMI